MSRKRALDLAQLLGAAASVAKKNAELHARQLDSFRRTPSSLNSKGTYQHTSTKEHGSSSPEDQTIHDVRNEHASTASAATPKRKQELSELRTPFSGIYGDVKAGDTPLNTIQASRRHGTVPQSTSKGPQAPIEQSFTLPKSQISADQQAEDDEMFSQLVHSPKVRKSLNSNASYVQRNLNSHAQPQPSPPSEKERPNPSTESVGAVQSNPVPLSDFTVPKDDPAQVPSGVHSTDVPKTGHMPASTTSSEAYQLRESKVPSSRIGRLWQYGGLASSMAFGAVGESLRRVTGSESNSSGSVMLSGANMERLVSKLSRMRGAALKLGQMISFQDVNMLPGPIQDVLQRVQDSADFMPAWQRDKVLAGNLGSDWRDLFVDFQDVPMAAASIGQVHRAVLKETGMPVAIKVQYPGVAESIDSDLSNLSTLLIMSRLLPKGLYLDKTIENARTELAWECDYKREAESAQRFSEFLADDTNTFVVPKVISQATSAQVITLELMHGIAVTKISDLTQEQRDWIGSNILRLCMRELFEFHFMQTDPNWTNFLYNSKTNKLELLDFGASRSYPIRFIGPYVRILQAAARGDRDTIATLSVQLGYLTGHESRTMRDAHVDSVLTLAEPFTDAAPDCYDFRNQTITNRVRALIPVMLRERLAPPPEETYSLHRKLSGAFLLCARLGSRVRAKEIFNNAVQSGRST